MSAELQPIFSCRGPENLGASADVSLTILSDGSREVGCPFVVKNSNGRLGCLQAPINSLFGHTHKECVHAHPLSSSS